MADRIDRNCKKSKIWINEVKKRDGFKCIKCDSDKKLCAHHIKSWKDHPELRYELSNGETLCRSCHMASHKNALGSKGRIAWNKGMKGLSSGMPKGSKFTPEHKEKLSLRKKGVTTWNKGIPMKEETKQIFTKMFQGKTWRIDPVNGKRKWINSGE